MKSGTLSKLVIITAVAVAGALWAWQGRGHEPPPEQGRLFVPSFDERINDAETITLASAEGTITLRQDGGDWGLDEWDGYPADFQAVKQTLMGLAGLEIVETKTAKAAKHAQLGLQGPDVPGGSSLGLSVTAKDGAKLAEIVLGMERTGHSDQRYARRLGEDQTWLVSGALAPSRTLADWVDKELLRLSGSDMVQVVISHPDGERVEVLKDSSDAWTLVSVPEGRLLSSGANFSSLSGALAYLDMEAVVPTAEQGDAEMAWTTTRFLRDDGLVVTVSSAERGDERWARFEFAYEEPAVEAADPVDASKAADDGDEAADETDLAAQAAAAELAAAETARQVTEELAELSGRLGGWTYRISSWKADSLVKGLEDYLEPLPEEPEPSGPPAVDGSSDDG